MTLAAEPKVLAKLFSAADGRRRFHMQIQSLLVSSFRSFFSRSQSIAFSKARCRWTSIYFVPNFSVHTSPRSKAWQLKLADRQGSSACFRTAISATSRACLRLQIEVAPPHQPWSMDEQLRRNGMMRQNLTVGSSNENQIHYSTSQERAI